MLLLLLLDNIFVLYYSYCYFSLFFFFIVKHNTLRESCIHIDFLPSLSTLFGFNEENSCFSLTTY